MHNIKISSQKIKFGDKEVDKKKFYSSKEAILFNPETFKILGWCPAGSVLPHGEKVPL